MIPSYHFWTYGKNDNLELGIHLTGNSEISELSLWPNLFNSGQRNSSFTFYRKGAIHIFSYFLGVGLLEYDQNFRQRW